MKPYKNFIIDIDKRGIVTMDIYTVFELIETIATSDDDEIDKLKESLFDVFARTTNEKNISG